MHHEPARIRLLRPERALKRSVQLNWLELNNHNNKNDDDDKSSSKLAANKHLQHLQLAKQLFEAGAGATTATTENKGQETKRKEKEKRILCKQANLLIKELDVLNWISWKWLGLIWLELAWVSLRHLTHSLKKMFSKPGVKQGILSQAEKDSWKEKTI